MPKEIKGHANRNPPEPLPNHREIDDWVKRQMPNIQNLVKRIDAMIRAAVPDLQYALSRNHAYYGLTDLGWIIELAPYHVSANILFLGGADFDPRPPLGNTDRTRYIKVTDISELKQPQLIDWVDQASRFPGWK